MTYYNTTSEKGRQLALYEAQTISQSKRIALYFKKYADRAFTASQIRTDVFGANTVTPLTSVRRALTDLAHMGILTKTNFKRPGVYGRMETLWCYNSQS